MKHLKDEWENRPCSGQSVWVEIDYSYVHILFILKIPQTLISKEPTRKLGRKFHFLLLLSPTHSLSFPPCINKWQKKLLFILACPA